MIVLFHVVLYSLHVRPIHTGLIESQLGKHLYSDLHAAPFFFLILIAFFVKNLFEKPGIMHGLRNLLGAKCNCVCDDPATLQEILLCNW